MDDKSKAREKESCVLLMSPRIWEGKAAHGWNGYRIV